MTIDHIALYTLDIERLSDFYENYFYAIRINDYENKGTNVLKRFLQFDGGIKLEIIMIPGIAGDTSKRPHVGYGHICISAGGRKGVDSVTARVFREGYHVIGIPQVTENGCYESCIEDPDGNTVEVME